MKSKFIGSLLAIGLLLGVATLARAQSTVKVGRKVFSFAQPGRLEQFGDAQGLRKIGGYIWYPAIPRGNSKPGPFISEPQASQLAGVIGIPTDLLQALPSRSYVDAPIANSGHRYPVIVMSHGDTGSPLESTSTAESLAAAGYIVVGISLTYNSEAGFVGDQLIFGDPSASVQTAPPVLDDNTTFADRLAKWDVSTRLNQYFARDISATIDELTRINGRPGPFRGRFDLSRIGVFGHSFGGSQSFRSLIDDIRIDAAANVDGTVFDDLYKVGTSKPFLSFRSTRPTVDQFDDTRRQLAGIGYSNSQVDWVFEHAFTDDIAFNNSRGAIQVSIPLAGHNNFTDRGLWQAFGIPSALVSTDIDPAYALRIYQTYLRAFFDEKLRGRFQFLLRRPSGTPDVEVRWSRR